MGASLDQLLQSFPARAERLSQERLVPFIKQIEDGVGDRKNWCEDVTLERGTGLVARKEQPEVRLALAQDHDLAVQDGPGREVVEEPELGITIGHVGPVAVDQAAAALFDEGQDAGAIPFHLEEVLCGIKRNPRLRQHGGHKPGELGDEDRPGHRTSQEILRSNRRVVFRVSFLGALVPWTRATLCFQASIRLITCGPSEAGAATISLPATLASINCCSLRV